MYYYVSYETGLWTVVCEDAYGKVHPDSDHGDREEAAKRVHYLNGGSAGLEEEIFKLQQRVDRLENTKVSQVSVEVDKMGNI